MVHSICILDAHRIEPFGRRLVKWNTSKNIHNKEAVLKKNGRFHDIIGPFMNYFVLISWCCRLFACS